MRVAPLELHGVAKGAIKGRCIAFGFNDISRLVPLAKQDATHVNGGIFCGIGAVALALCEVIV